MEAVVGLDSLRRCGERGARDGHGDGEQEPSAPEEQDRRCHASLSHVDARGALHFLLEDRQELLSAWAAARSRFHFRRHAPM
jgi:hypothetical protein